VTSSGPVVLRIAPAGENIVLARTVAASMCAQLNFPIDQLDDLRLAVDEACALLVKGDSADMRFGNLGTALAHPDTDLKLFGKPEVHGSRRLGVGLALGASIDEARAKARDVVAAIRVEL